MGRRASRGEARWFLTATSVGVLHAIDEAVVQRPAGVQLAQHSTALFVTVAVTCLTAVSYPRLLPGLRAVIAFSFGILALANGGTHVVHVMLAGPSSSDVTGMSAALSGLALVGLSAVVPYRHRGAFDRGVRRRWTVRVIATATLLVWVVIVVFPLATAVVQTHNARRPMGAPPSSSYVAVSFRSSDGLSLAGWYSPSRNGAAVVIVSSARGDRGGSVEHAELLAEHGYGVLLYDARGSGESEGSPNGYGWEWEHDVRGAMDFLQRRPDVDPERIGGLGLSTGADVLIEYAADDPEMRALVCDGATGRSLQDVSGSPWQLPAMFTLFSGVRLFAGTTPGPALSELVPDIAPTPLLLIAAGSIDDEIPLNERYAEVAQEPFELWALPEVAHTQAIREVAPEYERRVVSVFDTALLGE